MAAKNETGLTSWENEAIFRIRMIEVSEAVPTKRIEDLLTVI